MSKITASQAVELIGSNATKNVVNRLVKQGLLINHNPAAKPGKRTMFMLDSKEVREVKRFYQPKGKEWKKALLAARAAGTANVAPPKTVKQTRALVSKALDTIPAAAPTSGVLTRLSAIEESLARVESAVASLLKVWA